MLKPTAEGRNAPLVKEKRKLDDIHSKFDYAVERWKPIRAERKVDMRHVGGDPWKPKEKLARLQANRPCPATDEISQYLNQVINGVKSNPRATRFNPVGFGANDKTATFYEDKWREILYRSHAQQHTTRAFQNMVEGSYGYCKVRTEYVTDRPGDPSKPWSAFNQRLVVDGIPDPDCIYPDPDFLDSTGRDWKWLFEIETQTLRDFKRNFPKAEITNFSPELVKYAGDWISGKGQNQTLRIASFWEVEIERKILNAWEVRNPKTGGLEVYELFDAEVELTDKIKALKAKLVDKRDVDSPSVFQYRTNGVEILKKTPWVGNAIPYVSFYGKMLYVDDGSGPKLVIQSMPRLARNANMLLAYYLACEAEQIGMTPKVPWWVWKGSLDPKNMKLAQMANRVPVPVIEVDTVMTTGAQTPSLPTRVQWEPFIQAIEIAKESARRAIQASMGLTPLPTSMQRDQKLSGRGIDKLTDAGERGAYHYIDSYDNGLTRLAELAEDMIPKVYDTAGETPTLDAQKRPQNPFINAKLLPEGQQPPEDALPDIEGLHAVTIDVGLDFASDRAMASEFVDTFVTSQVFGALPPPMALEILALLVKLKNLGPIGNEIADILHPDNEDEQKVPMAKLQEVTQQGQKIIQALQGEIQRLEQEKQAKVIDNQGKLAIVAAQNESKERIEGGKAQAEMVLEHKKDAASMAEAEMQANVDLIIAKAQNQIELLRLKVQQSHETRELVTTTATTAAQLAHSAQEADRNRAHTSYEAERGGERSDRNAAEDRKIKAQSAAKPKPKGKT